MQKEKIASQLVEVIGQRLNSVLALIYTYDGEKNYTNPQELSLKFSSDVCVKFICSSDGASIELRDEELYESDMAELGSQAIEDVSSFPEWEQNLDELLISAKLINSSVDDCIIGVQLNFNSDSSHLSILNLGDELHIYQVIPNAVMSGQGVTFLKVV